MRLSTRARTVVACWSALLACAMLIALGAASASADPGANGGGVPVSAAALPTALELDTYLSAKGSPIAGQGAAIVAAGAANQLDPRLIVAIAGAESSFGQITCAPYNAWGYGCPDGPFHFSSWADGIDTIAQGLRTNYLNDGLTSVAQIQSRWAPSGAANDPTGLNNYWVANVTRFLLELGGNPGNVDLSAEHVPTGALVAAQLSLGPSAAAAASAPDYSFNTADAAPTGAVPGVATVDQPLRLEVPVTNSGKRAWTTDTVRLRRVDIEPRVASAPYAVITGQPVQPGGTATFVVDVAPAGSEGGTFTTEWRLEGPAGPFGDVITRSVTTRVDALVAVDPRVASPAQLQPGARGAIIVKLRNMGSKPWLRDEGQPVYLGIQSTSGPSLQDPRWAAPTVPARQLERDVEPGDWGTFAFPVTAPAGATGAATIALQAFTGSTWAGGQPISITVQVGTPAPASPTAAGTAQPAAAAPTVPAQ
jgi:hypothetical protein